MKNHPDFRKMERVIKGFANHRRLSILYLLKKKPELTVEDLAEQLKTSYENTSDHVRKLAITGLVAKRYDGPYVRHKLTPRAESILAFCLSSVAFAKEGKMLE